MLRSLNYAKFGHSEAPEAVPHESLEVVQPGLEAYVNNHSPTHELQKKHGLSRDAPSSHPSNRKICGLRPTTFMLTLAVVFLIMLLAGVGGGLGSVAQENMQKLSAAQSKIAELRSVTAGTPAATKTGANGIATVTVTSTAKATPTSDCLQKANQNYTSTDSGLSYTMLCGTVYSGGDPHLSYYGAVQETFEDCIMMCDSYNYQLNTRNVTSITYNYAGELGYPKGQCWCTNAVDYSILNEYGRDSAFLVGSFDQGDLP